VVQLLKQRKNTKALGHITPHEEWENMMKDCDVNGDGEIDLEEFKAMLRRKDDGKGGNNAILTGMPLLAKAVLADYKKKLENNVVGNDLWMISPLNAPHAVWDILVSLLIALTLITMPLSLGWEEFNQDFFYMNLAFDFIFLLDVVKNFITGFIDENDAVIMDAKRVRKNYATGFFFTDLCSSIPLDLILKGVSDGLRYFCIGHLTRSTRVCSLLTFNFFLLSHSFYILYLGRTCGRWRHRIWYEAIPQDVTSHSSGQAVSSPAPQSNVQVRQGFVGVV
jgi:hypothetical protein